jgi:hypothetical protein
VIQHVETPHVKEPGILAADVKQYGKCPNMQVKVKPLAQRLAFTCQSSPVVANKTKATNALPDNE